MCCLCVPFSKTLSLENIVKHFSYWPPLTTLCTSTGDGFLGCYVFEGSCSGPIAPCTCPPQIIAPIWITREPNPMSIRMPPARPAVTSCSTMSGSDVCPSARANATRVCTRRWRRWLWSGWRWRWLGGSGWRRLEGWRMPSEHQFLPCIEASWLFCIGPAILVAGVMWVVHPVDAGVSWGVITKVPCVSPWTSAPAPASAWSASAWSTTSAPSRCQHMPRPTGQCFVALCDTGELAEFLMNTKKALLTLAHVTHAMPCHFQSRLVMAKE